MFPHETKLDIRKYFPGEKPLLVSGDTTWWQVVYKTHTMRNWAPAAGRPLTWKEALAVRIMLDKELNQIV